MPYCPLATLRTALVVATTLVASLAAAQQGNEGGMGDLYFGLMLDARTGIPSASADLEVTLGPRILLGASNHHGGMVYDQPNIGADGRWHRRAYYDPGLNVVNVQPIALIGVGLPINDALSLAQDSSIENQEQVSHDALFSVGGGVRFTLFSGEDYALTFAGVEHLGQGKPFPAFVAALSFRL